MRIVKWSEEWELRMGMGNQNGEWEWGMGNGKWGMRNGNELEMPLSFKRQVQHISGVIAMKVSEISQYSRIGFNS